jgi:hypothetical protein
MRRSGLRAALVWAALAGALWAAPARADGLPVLGVDVGPVGVLGPAGEARYVTLPAGRDTVVARVERDGGRVLASTLLRGRRTVPAVAYDGSAGGLSADGRTLVLIEPRLAFPRLETTLDVLDARPLRLRRVVSLRGDFSFDAVSPRGRLLYLIQYLSPADPTRYLVRAFDVRAGRLLRKPVVDPREPGEEMRGSPLTRTTSAGGRWAYTLYGGGEAPFVHALDTATATARCVDLDALAGVDLSGARLRLQGASLAVADGGRAVALVDLRSFRAEAPLGPARATGSGLALWPFAAAAIVAALAGGLLATRRRRRRVLVPD